MYKPVLVTGANGFLGSEVVNRLLTAGHSVRATGKEPSYSHSDVEYIRADITQAAQLSAVTSEIAAVIHTAGLAHVFHRFAALADRFFQINELGAENVARAAAADGVEHFILISSVSVYGPSTHGLCTEESPCQPEGAYALSKLNAEHGVAELAKETGMAVTILRLATLYGEGDPGNVGRLMRSLDRGRFLWIGDGHNRKSLLYRGDAARACLAVLDKPPASGVATYNVSAPPCTMREIVETLSTALGKKPLPVRVPAGLAAQAARLASVLPVPAFSRLPATINKWLAEDIYDTRRIEQEIGFYPEITLQEGIQREVRWYREQQAREQE
ncbi:MAG TPA: NAD-dependent epimerase/dehydratase family protein [Chloroflexi bacterium]|nr:NAD-dependent epimerase/dehydratase family protein [Chloroflexota bacterium]